MVFSTAAPRAAAQTTKTPALRQLLKDIRKIERKVRKLRGLRPRGRYRKTVQPGPELQKVALDALDREHPDDQLAAEQAVWQRLGLLPAGADYKKILAGLGLPGGAMAYYDHRSRRLHVHKASRLPAQGPALAREVCHALQDQRFRVKRLMRPVKDNRDRQLARRALVGGDCAGVMLEYLLAPTGKDLGTLSGDVGAMLRRSAVKPTGKLAAAPPLVRETLLFPLIHGLLFVQKVRARHPWSVVNKIYRRPPRSTEQVLHPRKYWRRERPVRVRTRKLPTLADFTVVRKDVLGELILRVYLGQGVSEQGARRAAAGWGGDQLVVYRPPTPGLALGLVHLTTWDSEADALEFANAQRHVLLARKLKPVAGAQKDQWVYNESDTSQWSVQLFRRHVLTLGGFAPAIREKLQAEVWERWRVRGRRVRPK